MREHEWTDAERETYRRDGFVTVEDLMDADFSRHLAERFEYLFAGNFETGIEPEMCPVFIDGNTTPSSGLIMVNPWRCDHTVANVTLDAGLARMIADLNEWPGTRLLQDNLHWKPPGAPGGHFHRDFSYHRWAVPNRLASAWVALGDTTAEGGTLCLARGSHKWPVVSSTEYENKIAARGLEGFLNPDGYRADVERAGAAADQVPDFAHIEVPVGGGVFFNDHIWHGADPNDSRRHRKAISVHGLRPETVFHPTITDHIQCRYRKFGDPNLDEAFFPILWRQDGYRTEWLNDYMSQGSAASLSLIA
ncbi:MAG: phytanoyl-CoA dioxygenase family protein [Alphaproteobacteria bacterium]|nr:phytanoyl-CoA dioxygenase family protein [Alphaproteobacteria bacterium]